MSTQRRPGRLQLEMLQVSASRGSCASAAPNTAACGSGTDSVAAWASSSVLRECVHRAQKQSAGRHSVELGAGQKDVTYFWLNLITKGCASEQIRDVH
jgi:hypothetical protein